MALLETLTDQFNEAIDTAKWNSFTTGTATIDQSGGVVTATPPSSTAGSNYAGYTSDNTYDLTASYGFIQIAQAVNSAVGAQQYFKLVKDGSNDLQWLLENGSLQAKKCCGQPDECWLGDYLQLLDSPLVANQRS